MTVATTLVNVESELATMKAKLAIERINRRRGKVFSSKIMELVKTLKNVNEVNTRHNATRNFFNRLWVKEKPEYLIDGMEDEEIAETLAIPINMALTQNLHGAEVSAFDDEFCYMNLAWGGLGLDYHILGNCRDIWRELPISRFEVEAHKISMKRDTEGKDMIIDLGTWNWINSLTQVEN